MQYIDWLILTMDPFLIAPYRWIDNSLVGWWVGTFILAFWASLLGEFTLALAYKINHNTVTDRLEKTSSFHHRSFNALKSGDKKAYKAINRLANEEFGKSFFLLVAMGMSSLWPAFLAAAWLQERFGEIRFAFPFVKDGLNFVPYFIICYILARLVLIQIKRRIKTTGKQLLGPGQQA